MMNLLGARWRPKEEEKKAEGDVERERCVAVEAEAEAEAGDSSTVLEIVDSLDTLFF